VRKQATCRRSKLLEESKTEYLVMGCVSTDKSNFFWVIQIKRFSKMEIKQFCAGQFKALHEDTQEFPRKTKQKVPPGENKKVLHYYNQNIICGANHKKMSEIKKLVGEIIKFFKGKSKDGINQKTLRRVNLKNIVRGKLRSSLRCKSKRTSLRKVKVLWCKSNKFFVWQSINSFFWKIQKILLELIQKIYLGETRKLKINNFSVGKIKVLLIFVFLAKRVTS